MLRVTYSNKPEVLMAQLEAQLAADVGLPPRDPFSRVTLLSASQPLAAWVQRVLAERAGVVAGLETRLLRAYVASLVGGVFPGSVVVDREPIRDALLRRFLADDLAGADLADVRGYLQPGDGREAAIRSVQLAGQLGSVFEEYLYARPEMLDDWSRGKPSAWHGPDDALARWQRRLWADLVGPSGLLSGKDPRGRRYVLPTALLSSTTPLLPPGARPLYVFGLSFIGLFFHRVLARLAESVDVNVYALNPCMEFWEDLEPARDRGQPLRWRDAVPRRGVAEGAPDERDPLGLERTGEHRLLQQWGKPGRENIRLLSQATEGNASGIYVDPTHQGVSLLRQIQLDLVQRRPAGEIQRLPKEVAEDGSVELLLAPSLRRECDAVAGRIRRLLRDEPGLPLDAVQVLIADRDPGRYLGPLLAAFAEGGHDHAIPAQTVGLSVMRGDPVDEAADLLLGLPGTKLKRADVLRVLTHPVVCAGYEEGLTDTWTQWIDTLGIVHGLDDAAHDGTYLAGLDRLHWEQGLRRIGLGAFLASRADGVEQFYEHDGKRDLPDAAGVALADGAGALLLLARSLLADVTALSTAQLTPVEWAEVLAAMFSSYLTPRDDREERSRDACLRAARSLAGRDLAGTKLSFAVARELVKEMLGGGGGSAVTGGVRVSTLQASRAIPARVTFVVGLTEGAFPPGERVDPIDLRARKLRPGDLTDREKGNYVFLEALLCTRDRLLLTATDRNEITGETQNLSPVVTELLGVIDRSYLGRDADAKGAHPLVRRLGLWRADGTAAEDACFVPSPATLAERRLRQVGEEMAVRFPIGKDARLRDVLAALDDATAAPLAALLKLPPVPASQRGSREAELRRVTLSQLRGFLRNPLQGAATVRLGLRAEDDADPAERTHETFGLSSLTRSGLLRRVFVDGLRGSGGKPPTSEQWGVAYGARTELLEAAGRAPLGAFGDVEREAALAMLAAWAAQLEGHGAEGLFPVGYTRFGAAEEREDVDVVLPALSLDLEVPDGATATRPIRVELLGRTNPLLGRSAPLVLQTKDRIQQGTADQFGRAIDAWLDLVVAAAGTPDGTNQTEIGLVGSRSHWFVKVAPIAQEPARAYLRGVLGDLFATEHHVLFPRDIALKWAMERGSSLEAEVKKALRGDRPFAFDGPVPHAAGFPVPTDADARALLDARFGLFRETVEEFREAIGASDRPAEGPAPAPPKARAKASKKRGAP